MAVSPLFLIAKSQKKGSKKKKKICKKKSLLKKKKCVKKIFRYPEKFKDYDPKSIKNEHKQIDFDKYVDNLVATYQK